MLLQADKHGITDPRPAVYISFDFIDETLEKVGPSAYKVLLVLLSHADASGETYINRHDLAHFTKMSRNTVKAAMRELIGLELVREHADGHFTVNGPFVVVPRKNAFPPLKCWRCGCVVADARQLQTHYLDRNHDNSAEENKVRLCLNCHALDSQHIRRIDRIEPDWAIRTYRGEE